VSSGPNLYIDFIVDGQRQMTGFEASFEFVGDSDMFLGPVGGGTDLPPTLHVDSPTLLQQSEGHHATANEIIPSYHSGTRLSLS